MSGKSGDGAGFGRIVVGLAVLALGGGLVWDITLPDPPRSEQLPACAPASGYPCTFPRADGTRMVRWVTTARGLEETTAAEHDEAYLDWLQEGAPACRGTGIGRSAGADEPDPGRVSRCPPAPQSHSRATTKRIAPSRNAAREA
jgi:hypothetical protein